jgi:hypothetical protein
MAGFWRRFFQSLFAAMGGVGSLGAATVSARNVARDKGSSMLGATQTGNLRRASRVN